MTTTPDILTQLQNAWQSAGVTSGSLTTEAPPTEPKQFGGVLLTGKTEPCRYHSQPLYMIDEPDENRPGWIRSKCRHCGKFLGYREINGPSKMKNSKLGRRAESRNNSPAASVLFR